MSDPVTTQPESILDDLLEALDIQEDNNGITKVREHFTIQIHKIVPASTIPSTGNIGVTKKSIPYSVGGVSKVKDPPVGGGVFLCVADGVTPLEHPGDMCIRRQTWESFGALVDPPAGWIT
jgi:hypothetical protein